jgi:aminopeptidase N
LKQLICSVCVSFFCVFISFAGVSKSLSAAKDVERIGSVKTLPDGDDENDNYISENQNKIDITHYDINLSLLPEIKNIEASVIISGLFKEKGLKNIDLNFYDNLTISSVLFNGIKTGYTNKGSRLTINVPVVDYNDTFKINIAYKGKPKNLGLSSFVFGEINNKSLVYSLNEPNYASTWFPCNDIPNDKALLDIKITNDSSRISVSNGKLVEVITGGNKRTYHWKTYYPISTYLICLFSSAYVNLQDKYISSASDTLALEYYVLPEHKKMAEKDFEDHPKFLKVFEKLFGAYPFIKEKYGVAEFLWQMGAMENQTITGIGSNLVSGKKLFNDIYVHELAHHWWGDAVSPASWKDIWLNEGFATYSEALYFEAESGFDALKSTMNSKYKRYFKERLYNTDGDLFSQTVYNKGAWVLHMLRKETGDSVFFKILREYFNEYKFKNASTNDFKLVCEKLSGKNLTHFFNQWVYEGTGIIEVEYNWTAEKKDSVYKVKLNLIQFQKEFPEYHFSLDVKLVCEGENKFVTKTIYVDSKNKQIELDSAEKPVRIIFDPDNWLLAYFVNSADKEN